MIPAIAALTAATYQGKQRAVAYGILGGVSGASMAAGPLIGGWVSAEYSWRYVFAAESVVVVVILLFLRIIPAVQGHKTKLDTTGAVLSALGLGSIVLGILRSSQWGWITPSAGVPEVNGHPLTPLGLSPTLWLIVIGSILLVVFGRRERAVKDRGDEPLLDLALLKIPRMRAGLVVQWCQAFIIQATFFVLPLYLQTVLGFDSLKTGVTILPMSVGDVRLRPRRFGADRSLLRQADRPARHRRDAASERWCCCTSWTRSSAGGASASGWRCSAPASGCWPPRSAT